MDYKDLQTKYGTEAAQMQRNVLAAQGVFDVIKRAHSEAKRRYNELRPKDFKELPTAEFEQARREFFEIGNELRKAEQNLLQAQSAGVDFKAAAADLVKRYNG